MGTVTVTKEFDCASNPCALWDVIANTDHLNRAIGMAPITLVPLKDPTAARYLVSTRLGGFAVEYEELPYEWLKPERFAVRRKMRKGPARSLEMAFSLRPHEGGTRVTLSLSVEPRFAVIIPIAHVTGRQTLSRLAQVILAIDRDLASGRASTLCRAPRVAGVALDRAAEALRRAEGKDAASQALAERLIALVRDGEDTDVDRVRPFALASRWQMDPDRVLALCLHAVLAGLLDLSWDLICPSCRTASERLPTLSELGAEGHCHLCDIRFGLDLDRAVEATFRPAAAVRTVDVGPYCTGGPAQTPHVLWQRILAPGGAEELAAPEEPGRYRLFCRGGVAASVTVEAGAPAAAGVRFTAAGAEPAEARIAPGGGLRVELAEQDERHVKLERMDWASEAATAHRVSTSPLFRRLFAKEALRPGLTLKVARVALLFSDLTGSTALYSRMGDALAFRLVQDHFAILEEVITAEGGVLIKTIGDAVMAAFSSEDAAVRAAVLSQERFTGFQGRDDQARQVSLKVGVYAGPCYVVTANGVLDYFGQTVNIAARLQGLATAGEIVLEAELSRKSAPLLAGLAVSPPFAAHLKGLDAPIQAVRAKADPLRPFEPQKPRPS